MKKIIIVCSSGLFLFFLFFLWMQRDSIPDAESLNSDTVKDTLWLTKDNLEANKVDLVKIRQFLRPDANSDGIFFYSKEAAAVCVMGQSWSETSMPRVAYEDSEYYYFFPSDHALADEHYLVHVTATTGWISAWGAACKKGTKKVFQWDIKEKAE